MKKYISAILAVLMITCSMTANAFELKAAKPDDNFIQALGCDIDDDMQYIRSIANSCSGKYVVTEEKYIDTGPIDDFFNKLSEPLAIEELDAGKSNFVAGDLIGSKQYRDQLISFKVFGGLSGYSAQFEPVAFFHIYRDIALIGGYVIYTKTYQNPDDAYWQYISRVEAMTKEIIPYETRLNLLEQIRELNSFMGNDKSFKIFILKNNVIDSMYERGT